jgi:O-acetylhomoserine/O-acetylserine sulfhydrylase-like pyridoxal-dependent enzyme
MDKHCSNAIAVANFLESHPTVDSVNYPGLTSNHYHCLQEVNHLKGFSSLMSFIIKGTNDDAVKFIDSVELLTHATHMGASKSIVTHPASTTHSVMGGEEMHKAVHTVLNQIIYWHRRSRRPYCRYRAGL